MEELQGSGKSDLEPLEVEIPEWLDRTVPDEPPFDPPAPLELERLFEQLEPRRDLKISSRTWR